MAVRINAGDVGRGDVFFIDPQEIIVDEKLSGRWTPHDAEAVEDMAKSLRPKASCSRSRSARWRTTGCSWCWATGDTGPLCFTTSATPTAR